MIRIMKLIAGATVLCAVPFAPISAEEQRPASAAISANEDKICGFVGLENAVPLRSLRASSELLLRAAEINPMATIGLYRALEKFDADGALTGITIDKGELALLRTYSVEEVSKAVVGPGETYPVGKPIEDGVIVVTIDIDSLSGDLENGGSGVTVARAFLETSDGSREPWGVPVRVEIELEETTTVPATGETVESFRALSVARAGD